MRPRRKYRDPRQFVLIMKPIHDVNTSLMRYHNSLSTVARHGRRRMQKIDQPSQVPFADSVGVAWGNPVYQLHSIEMEDVVEEPGLELSQK